jgi:hypothetical protein
MKKIIAIILFTGLAVGASAQHIRRPYHGSRVRTHIGIGFGVGGGYYGPRYGFYDPFYTYPYGSYYDRPTRLELQIHDIRNDYQDRIWSAKHDKSLSRQERRSTVRNLKSQREKAIYDARRNYYRHY